jgi:hypothetical protein
MFHFFLGYTKDIGTYSFPSSAVAYGKAAIIRNPVKEMMRVVRFIDPPFLN